MLETIPGWIFVVGVSLLIATIAYSSQFFILLPALGWWSAESLKALGPFNVLVLMVYYNYYLACSTDPGRVPAGWEPPYSTFQKQDNNNSLSESPPQRRWRRPEELPVSETGMTGPRFCKSCKCYKPPRTHHCRYCRRCVLKMDHHCPWISNCVGHDNYGHFIRFILYVDIACGYALGLLVWRVRCIMDDIRHFRFQAEPTKTEVVFLVLNFVLAFVVIFCVGILSIYHMYCLARNQSSIESWERSKVKTLIRRGKILPVHYPFDVGVYKNICSVLGNNPLLWLWPQRVSGDGLVFPVRPGTDPRLPYCWPPRDPDDLRPSIYSARYRRQQLRKERRARKAMINGGVVNAPAPPRLVRRDSEGYLVREITMEERMQMLQQSSAYTNEVQDDDDRESMDSVEDYYDSGSCISGDDDLGAPRSDEEHAGVMSDQRARWMENRVMDLSGGDLLDYESGSSWETDEDSMQEEQERPMLSRHRDCRRQRQDICDDAVNDTNDREEDNPLSTHQHRPSTTSSSPWLQSTTAVLSNKAAKED